MLIIDFSSLISLKRAQIIKFLDNMGHQIIISENVHKEVRNVLENLKKNRS